MSRQIRSRARRSFNKPSVAEALDPADAGPGGTRLRLRDTIYIRVGRRWPENSDVKYEGEGCTIGQAAASILMEMMDEEHPPLSKVLSMDYNDMIDILGREAVATRPKCATLALGTLKAAIRKYLKDRVREGASEDILRLAEGDPSADEGLLWRRGGPEHAGWSVSNADATGEFAWL